MANSELSRSSILKKETRLIHLGQAVADGHQIIDVRSAAEYSTGTIPGALNIPLFDDDERSVIGTLYKHAGHEQAVDKGFDYVQQKLDQLVGAFAPYRNKVVTVFCARGGMRSRSVVNLLLQSGFTAFQLEGGYKLYRRNVLDVIDTFQPKLIVIHGLTGTGKTRILQRLENCIDLEELASHRSSLFGGLDREPSTQKIFESRLASVIDRLGGEPYFIEGESRKIGPVYIPKPLARAMKRGILVRVHCSIETRISRIIDDYPVTDGKVLKEIEVILRSLTRKLGTTRVEELCRLLKNGDLRELVRILLLDYYDKRYGRSMESYQYEFELSSENIAEAADKLVDFRSRRCEKRNLPSPL
ncbi:MAG: tRNA 2-selenouridine(34) synthase MnmH [Desulforhopalus sp.]